MLDKLITWDTSLFRLINNNRSEIADWIFAFIGSHLMIFVVVVLSTAYLIIKNKGKYFYLYILVVGLCFLLADRLSVICFKDIVCRLRPSHQLLDVCNVKLSGLHLVYGYKGGLYGFVSSHASNVFCLITCFALMLFNTKNNIGDNHHLNLHKIPNATWIIVFVWVFWGLMVCYSRIYCGYHYPLDTICGSLFGIILGLIISCLFFFVKNKLVIRQINKQNK